VLQNKAQGMFGSLASGWPNLTLAEQAEWDQRPFHNWYGLKNYLAYNTQLVQLGVAVANTPIYGYTVGEQNNVFDFVSLIAGRLCVGLSSGANAPPYKNWFMSRPRDNLNYTGEGLHFLGNPPLTYPQQYVYVGSSPSFGSDSSYVMDIDDNFRAAWGDPAWIFDIPNFYTSFQIYPVPVAAGAYQGRVYETYGYDHENIPPTVYPETGPNTLLYKWNGTPY
jgi:hypothetical protein